MNGDFGDIFEVLSFNSNSLKWKFFLLGIIMKNSSRNSIFYDAFLLLLNIIVELYPILYLLRGFNPEYYDLGHDLSSIFPLSDFLSFLSPQTLSVRLFLLVMIVFCSFVVFAFILCIINPVNFFSLRYFLSMRLNLVFLPFISGIFGYSLEVLIKSFIFNEISFPLILILVFIPYLFVLCSLQFLEINAITSPRIAFSAWFTNSGPLYPLAICIISTIAFRVPSMNMLCSILFSVLSIFLCLMILLMIFNGSPLFLFVSNDIVSAKMFLYIVIHFIYITRHFSSFGYPIFLFTLVPIHFVTAFYLSVLISSIRRRNMRLLLLEFDRGNDSISFESLETTLSSVTKENDLIFLIKEGLLTGNKSVISHVFIEYCLSKYPSCEWLVSYVSFLYTVIYPMNPSVYKFFLHILSISVFSYSTDFVIFQLLFIFMQVSNPTSPIISRALSKIRLIEHMYSLAHYDFWGSSANRETEGFHKKIIKLYEISCVQSKVMKYLSAAFPFSPQIACHKSIFYSDFCHDYVEGDQAFRVVGELSENGIEYVTNTLVRGFGAFFHGLYSRDHSSILNNDLTFFSYKENIDGSSKIGSSYFPNDDYFHTRIFTHKKPSMYTDVDPVFNKWKSVILSIILASGVFVYLFLFYPHHSMTLSIQKMRSRYTDIVNLMNYTAQMRAFVHVSDYSFRLAHEITDNMVYDPIINTSKRFINRIIEGTFGFKKQIDFIFQEYSDILTNSLSYYYSNTTFSRLYSQFHKIFLFFLSSDSSSSQLSNETYHEFLSSTSELKEFLNILYNDSYHVLKSDFIDSYSIMNISHYRILIIEIIMIILVPLIGGYISFSIKKDVFSIIKTSQPPVLQSIAYCYSSIMGFQYSTNSRFRFWYRVEFKSLSFMTFTLLLLFPLFLITYFNNLDIDIPPLICLPDLVVMNDSSYIIFKSLVISCFNRSDEFIDTNNLHVLFYDLVTYISDTILPSIPFYEKMNFSSMLAKQSLFLGASMVTFALYCWAIILEKRFNNFSKSLLKYIPPSLSKSNPLMNKLSYGISISSKDIKDFENDLKKSDFEPDFFTLFRTDDDGIFIDQYGRLSQNMNLLSKTKTDLLIELKDLMPLFNDDITRFENGIMNQVSIPFPSMEEYYLENRSPEKSLLFKNDSYKYEENSKNRKFNKMIDFINQKQNLSSFFLNDSVMFIIKYEHSESIKELFDILNDLDNIVMGDCRYDRIVGHFSNIDKTYVNAFLSTLKNFIPLIRIVLHNGLPTIFSGAKQSNQYKQKYNGMLFEECLALLRISKIGDVIITSDLASDIENKTLIGSLCVFQNRNLPYFRINC